MQNEVQRVIISVHSVQWPGALSFCMFGTFLSTSHMECRDRESASQKAEKLSTWSV